MNCIKTQVLATFNISDDQGSSFELYSYSITYLGLWHTFWLLSHCPEKKFRFTSISSVPKCFLLSLLKKVPWMWISNNSGNLQPDKKLDNYQFFHLLAASCVPISLSLNRRKTLDKFQLASVQCVNLSNLSCLIP